MIRHSSDNDNALRVTNHESQITHHSHPDSVGGAHERDRTVDLVLTKDVLYQLSYVGRVHLERVMGIEPT